VIATGWHAHRSIWTGLKVGLSLAICVPQIGRCPPVGVEAGRCWLSPLQRRILPTNTCFGLILSGSGGADAGCTDKCGPGPGNVVAPGRIKELRESARERGLVSGGARSEGEHSVSALPGCRVWLDMPGATAAIGGIIEVTSSRSSSNQLS